MQGRQDVNYVRRALSAGSVAHQRYIRRTALAVALIAASFGLFATGASAAAKAGPAPLGVYRAAAEPGAIRTFGKWLGRQPAYALDFLSQGSWENIGYPVWWAGHWEGARYRLVYSIPMVPTDGVSSLTAGAQGAYDKHFKKIAQVLVSHGQGNAVIRLGWEMNGDWFAWSAKGQEAQFIEYWQRAVKTMRKVKGAKFKFEWSPVFGPTSIDPETVYPGDAWVDYIGMSVFDQGYFEGWEDPDRRWHEMVLGFRFGLLWHRDFAAAHGKKLTYPEWGVIVRDDGHGGGDNPTFIKRMHTWFKANSRDIAYQIYFDPKPGSFAESFPRSAAMFRKLFKKPFTNGRSLEPRLRAASKRQIEASSGLTLAIKGLKPGKLIPSKPRVVRALVEAPLGIRRTAFRVNGKLICMRAGAETRRCKLPAMKRGTHTLVITVTDGAAWAVQEIVRFRVRGSRRAF